MTNDNIFNKQGWNLAHYAFSKNVLKPTVYYEKELNCTLVFDNKKFYCFSGQDLSFEVFVLTKEPNGTFGLFSDYTFAECERYIDYVIDACEGDLSKVSVYSLDFDDEPLSSLIGLIDIDDN